MYKLKNTLAGHKRSVNRARFSNSGKYLASAGADKTVKVWNIEKGFLLENFEEHEDGVNDVCWSSNDRYIASGSDDRSIILWSIEGVRNKDHAVKVLKGHTNYVLCVCYNPQCNLLASGSFDETVRIWDVLRGKCLRTISAHSDPVTSIDFSNDSSYIASCSTDGLIRIWDIWSGQCLKTLVDESNKQATFLKFSPNSQYLLSASLDHMVKLWAYASKERPIRTYTGHDNSIYAQSIDFGYFKEKRCVIAGSEDGKVFVWDLQSKEVLHSFTAHKGIIDKLDAVINVDSHSRLPLICSCSLEKDLTIKIWEYVPGDTEMIEDSNVPSNEVMNDD
ncbi:hypothetical protein E3P81_03285 [Wallemia ichthyophaga]|nr:hypothetical protein E3P97_03334 [Wallemia ichthyophaga]TIB02971.1 hypothetical protein E3P96_02010 [Wallemia ichthyophaga]TIB28521.1 hypothetical protein E3P85_03624 [Wallemia ichthyophaga]TIB44876.1 hypothetical protein E3P82_03302 [Wallemia ichthyophaga]TIB47401.1 hypothetical protein E3P81_03285 [Wallemia ichthyophaga]